MSAEAFKDTKNWYTDIIKTPSVDSTLNMIKELAAGHAEHGTVAAADIQTGGYGRRNRVWLSPKGGLYISILLRPQKPLAGLSLMFGLWICDFLESETGVSCSIVWPNDIYCKKRKLGGILIEGKLGKDNQIFVGIGLNINAKVENNETDIKKREPVSLCELTDRQYNLDHLLEDLLMHLQFNYELFEKSSFKNYKNLILDRCLAAGTKVEITDEKETFKAEIKDIGDEGELIAQDENGTTRNIWTCERLTVL